MIKFAFDSHIGLVREKQEDALGNVGSKFFVVGDGLGGHPGGEVAANLAVEKVIKTYKGKKVKTQNHLGGDRMGFPEVKKPEQSEIILEEVFKCANKKIIDFSHKHPNYWGMATTLVSAIVEDGNWWLGNIGDSRGYLSSDGLLKQITVDHEEPSGALTRAVGLGSDATPDIFSGNFKTSDLILLTTDGLTNFISDQTVQNVLFSESDIKKMATRLVKLSLDAGGLDNVTVCLIKWYS